jgi:hypothetical protein
MPALPTTAAPSDLASGPAAAITPSAMMTVASE